MKLSRSLIVLLAAIQLAAVGCARYEGPRRVAVIDFENTVADPQLTHLSQTMAEYLTASLVNDSRIVVVERREVTAAEGKGSLVAFLMGNPSKLKRLGKRIGADYIVVGSVSRLEENFVLTARLFSVATGTVVPGTSASKSCRREEDLYPLVESLSRFIAYQAGSYEQRVRLANVAPEGNELPPPMIQEAGPDDAKLAIK